MLYVHLLNIDTFPLSNSLFALNSLSIFNMYVCMHMCVSVCVCTHKGEKNLFYFFAEGPVNGIEDVHAGNVEAN